MTAHSIARPSIAQRLWPAAGAQAALLRAVVLAVFGSLLLALSAKVQVPFWPVPMTMQTFVVLMLGAAYGWRLGGATVLLYLAEGALGLPVFAGAGAGPAYMMGPTGGYLAGFLVAAVATGFLVERGLVGRDGGRNLALLTLAMLIGHALILAPGVAWLALTIGWTKAVAVGLTPFWAATVLKTALAVAAVLGLDRVVGKAAR
jgi:biotin transport system substrate-specific component